MLLAAGCYSAAATQWYVSTNGLPTNAGTLASPWDLGTSMTNAPVAGGDTVWIQAGTYPGTYAITLSGSSSNAPIIYRNYQYGLVKLVGPAWSADNFTTVNANELSLLNSNIWVWGLDVSYAPTNRMNATTSASPTWLLGSGIDLLGAANCKVINCIVHDALDGITAWSSDACAEITGNLVYNIGMEGADRGHGHNIYVQNGVSPSDTTRKVIRNNVSFNGFDANFHAYTQGSYVNNMDVTNNVFFNGGIYYTNYNAYVFEGGNLVMGGYIGHGVVGGNVSGNVFVNGNADFGYDGATNGSLTFNNNWSISNVVNVVYFSNLTAMGNASLPTINQAQYRVAGLPASYLINSNIYWSAQGTPAYGADLYGGQTVPFQDWRTNGWDLNSYCYATLPTTNWVWASPNPYDANICYVAIVNWLSNSTVTAALPGLLASGASYTVRNVQNYYGAPVATGVYSGSITVPMTNLSVAAPVAWTSCPPIGPFFGAFVVTASSTNNGAVLNLVTMSDLNTAMAAAQSAGATNAISNTNGVGYGLTVLDGVRATNFIGNANGLTNLNGSTIQFATIGPKACGFSIVTNTATNIVLAGVFSGDGSGLSNVLASIGQAGTLSNANTTITASGIASAQATITNLTFQGATMVDTNNNPVFAVRGSVTLANQFIGLDGGKFDTTGYDDVANGFEAMGKLTTGHDNEANGWYALGFSTNGNYNTANGSSALMYDYSGNGSTAEGYQALMYASNHFNTAMGAYAMVNASNAVGCVALGVQAGQGNISNEWSLADQYCGWLGFSASRDPSLPISTALTNAWALGYTATVSNNNTLSIGGPAQPMTLLAAKIISTNFTGNGAGMTNVAGLSTGLSNWVSSAASGTSSNAVTNVVQGMVGSISGSTLTISNGLAVDFGHQFAGNQGGITNGSGQTIATQISAASNSLVATFSFTNAIVTPFTNVAVSGTVWISPTNGNFQCYVLTNSGPYLCPIFGTRSSDELIRLTIYSTNLASPTYYMPASNVFNSALAVVSSATNVVTTSFILDHDADTSGTNLFTVFRLK